MKEYNEYKPKTFIDQLLFEDIPFIEKIWIKLLDNKEHNNKNFNVLEKYKTIMKSPNFKNLRFLDSEHITNLDIVEYTSDVRKQLLDYYNKE